MRFTQLHEIVGHDNDNSDDVLTGPMTEIFNNIANIVSVTVEPDFEPSFGSEKHRAPTMKVKTKQKSPARRKKEVSLWFWL